MPSLRGPGLRAVGDQTSPTDVAPAALPQQDRTGLSWTRMPQHHGLPTPYLWRRSPVPQGAPHDLLPDTSDTDVGCPNLKDGDEVDADDLVLHLGQVDDVEDQVLQDLTFRRP